MWFGQTDTALWMYFVIWFTFDKQYLLSDTNSYKGRLREKEDGEREGGGGGREERETERERAERQRRERERA